MGFRIEITEYSYSEKIVYRGRLQRTPEKTRILIKVSSASNPLFRKSILNK